MLIHKPALLFLISNYDNFEFNMIVRIDQQNIHTNT